MEWTAIWCARAGSAVVWTAAGACVFVFLLSRVLLPMPDGMLKRLLALAALLAGTAGAAAWGWRTGPGPWLVMPAVLLAVAAGGEVVHRRVQRTFRGSGPVSTAQRRIRLTRPFTTTDMHVLRYELPVPSWHGPRVRIAHFSDLHFNRLLPESYFVEVVERVNDVRPDLVFVTGDFVSRARHVDMVPRILGRLRAACGVYGVLGNHDFWSDPMAVRDAARTAGVELVGDRCVGVRVGGGLLRVAGCEMPWGRTPWIPPPAADAPLLALTHTADTVYALARAGACAAFAGHFHAGQFRLPGIGAVVVPSAMGRRFDHGHFVVQGTHLFVSAGIGVEAPPLRLFCHPDLFVVDLLCGSGAAPHGGAPASVPGPARIDRAESAAMGEDTGVAG